MKDQTIIFHRNGFWYPVEYPVGYSNWKAEAERNPGTTRIETASGKVLWPTIKAVSTDGAQS